MQYFQTQQMTGKDKIKAAIAVLVIAVIVIVLTHLNQSNFDNRKEIQLGISSFQRGEIDNAIKHFKTVLETDPDNTETIMIYLGVCEFSNNKNREAEGWFDKALEIDPVNPDAFYLRGLLFFETEKFDKALTDFTNAIENFRYNPIEFRKYEAYFHRALSRHEITDIKGAIEDLNESIKLNPNFAEAYLHRGKSSESLGNVVEAANDYEELLRLRPDYSNAKELRKYIQIHLGRNSRY